MYRSIAQTTLALAGAILFAWAATAHAEAYTLHSDDGLSEIRLPGKHWLVRPHIGKSAALRASDTQGDSVFVVNTYLPDEIDPMPLDKLAKQLSTNILESLHDSRISPASKLTIQDRPAVQYEISGLNGDTRFTYLSTVVEGKSARHHLIAWLPEASDKASLNALRKMFSSFRESAKPRKAMERIDLVFNWPKQGKAAVAFEYRNQKRNAGFEMRGTGHATWRPLGERELLIGTQMGDFNMKSNGKKEDRNKDAYMQNLVQQAMSQIPDYVVSTEGDFIRVENLGEYYSRLEKALLQGLPGDNDEAKEKVKQLMNSLISEESLRASLEDDWNGNIYNWTGGSYRVGEIYTYAMQYQTPTFGGMEFPMTLTQQLTGRVPCHANDARQSCVRLVQTTRVADPSYTRAMQQFIVKTVQDLAGANAKDIKLSVDRAEVVTTRTLIAEPETMMIHEEHESTVKTTVISEGGRSETALDTEETTTRYSY